MGISLETLSVGLTIVGGIFYFVFYTINGLSKKLDSSDFSDYAKEHERMHLEINKEIKGNYESINNHLINIGMAIGRLEGRDK